jgi:hypothetical protein
VFLAAGLTLDILGKKGTYMVSTLSCEATKEQI